MSKEKKALMTPKEKKAAKKLKKKLQAFLQTIPKSDLTERKWFLRSD